MPASLRPLFALLLLLVGASASLAQQLQSFPTADLTIETAGGPRKFHVELATTPPQLEQGLMFRRTLAPDAGMLFDFKTPSPVSMWMKNTFIPLDMVFIDGEGRIQQIVEQATPHSLAIINSNEPALAVLEIAGGEAKRLGLHPGQRVLHAALVGYHP